MKLLRKHDSSVKPMRIHHALLCLEKKDAAIVHLNHSLSLSLSGGLGVLYFEGTNVQKILSGFPQGKHVYTCSAFFFFSREKYMKQLFHDL